MPLSSNLVGLWARSTYYMSGIVKDAEEFKHTHSPKEVNAKANSVFEKAEANLKTARSRAQKQLTELGELRSQVWSEQLGRFAELFSRLKDVEFTGSPDAAELQDLKLKISEMKELSLEMGHVVRGVAAAGSGAAVGTAGFLSVAAWGTASTGTAIGSLSGAAATNATLAWFGGGSLAAGGLGVTGGICVLGGIVAIPVLVVGGVELYAYEKKQLSNAKASLAQATIASAEMNSAAMICDGIRKVALQFTDAIKTFRGQLDKMLDGFEELLNFEEQLLDSHDGTELISYEKLDPDVQRRIQTTMLAIQVMKLLLETPILKEDGALCADSQEALDKAKEYKPLTN